MPTWPSQAFPGLRAQSRLWHRRGWGASCVWRLRPSVAGSPAWICCSSPPAWPRSSATASTTRRRAKSCPAREPRGPRMRFLQQKTRHGRFGLEGVQEGGRSGTRFVFRWWAGRRWATPRPAEQGCQRVLAAAGPRRGHHVVEQEKPPPAEGRQCPFRTGGRNGPLCGSPFSRSQEQMRKKFVLTHILGTFAFRTNTVCTPEIFFQVPVGVGRAGTLPEAGLSCIFGTKRRKKIWTPKLVGPLSPPPRKVQCGGIPEFIPGVLLMPRPTSPHAQQSSHSIPGH